MERASSLDYPIRGHKSDSPSKRDGKDRSGVDDVVKRLKDELRALTEQSSGNEHAILVAELKKLERGRLKRIVQMMGWSLVLLSGGPAQYVPHRTGWDDVAQLPETAAARAEELPSPAEMLLYLRRHLGEAELQLLFPAAETDSTAWEAQQHQERLEPRVEVTGAEFLGMSNQDLQEYVVRGFPLQLTGRTSVSRIEVTDALVPVPSEYGIGGYVSGVRRTSADGNSVEVLLTLESVNRQPGTAAARPILTRILPHELIHGGVMRGGATLDPRTRLEVYYMATRRVLGPNPLQFYEVNAIRNSNPQHALALKITEYIPETAHAMFGYRLSHVTDPRGRLTWQQGMATRLAQDYHSTPEAALEDVRMIERVVGPSFHWEEAAEVRERILSRSITEHGVASIRAAAAELRDPHLRDELTRAMNTPRRSMSDIYLATILTEEDVEEPEKSMGDDRETEEARIQRECETVRHVAEFRDQEIARLRRQIPPEAGPFFDHWTSIVDRMREARVYIWHPHEEDTVIRDVVIQLHLAVQRFEGIRPEQATWGQDRRVQEAMMRYLRVAGYGELTLPEPLATQARRLNETSLTSH